jgi:NTE family protein
LDLFRTNLDINLKTGITLSGGGARGIAHIGVLQGLDELGIKPAVISAVSSGALVGVLYAAGYTPAKILEAVKQYSSPGFIKMIMHPGGLFSQEGIREVLKTMVPADDFSKLKIPLVVTATDISSNTPVVFAEGPLHNVIIGSCAIPGIFTPIKHAGHCLVDGGISDNFPTTAIRDKCDQLIGVHVNKLYPLECETVGRMQVIERSFHLAVSDTVALHSLHCDILIEPDLKDYTMFEMKNAEKIYDEGYRAVLEQKDRLLDLLG